MDAIFQRNEIHLGTTCIHTVAYPEFIPEDYLHVLNDVELERYLSFGHLKRQREFIATRALRHELFGNEHIHYTPEGAPYIDKDTYISISHSGNVVAIAENHAFPVGLDLELIRQDIQRLMHKFLSKEELQHFDCNDSQLVTSIWSAKETLYKLAGRKQILFSDELHISREEDQWKGRIINPEHDLLVNLDIFEREGIIYTLNSSRVEYIKRDS
ncbi:4'-phosphopantetheinyl transferase superfamily protein [Crocinitomicaceae bacterium]|nr:4'-phosphopantetheinyl transferase superfamily protein [Crocinitomicaceae bacterium]